MEYLMQYAMFLAKAATIVIAIIFVISVITSSGIKQRKGSKRGILTVTPLNDHIKDMREALRRSVLEKDELKQTHKEEKKLAKAELKEKNKKLKQSKSGVAGKDTAAERTKRVYVLHFTGDIAAEAVASLREEITAVLSMAKQSDEVLLKLESPGGMVHAYGLASSQLLRIKNAAIPLTICVDKVAASGGYMMACLADKLVAAPFAIIGSIGVLVQLPNFHRILKKNEVDYEIITAGEFKRTLTQFGEITQKAREKVQEDVDTMHDLFKRWVKEHRPSVDIDAIATGETWVGIQAKERFMVDELRTSDECIVTACDSADVFEVEYEIRKSVMDKLGTVFEMTVYRIYSRWFEKSSPNNYQ